MITSLTLKKILFFRIWHDPPIAKSVAEMLTKHFPDYQIEIIDIWRLLKQEKRIMLVNILFTLREYWQQIIFRKMNPKAAFFRTPLVFNYVKLLAMQASEISNNIAFTFQLQSIFNTCVPGIPNFVYTDHTHLANLWYSGQGKVALYSADWIKLEKSIYTSSALIFTRSTNISRSLIQQYGISESKVECVFAGMNVPWQLSETGEKDYSSQIILFVGMDWNRKGGPMLVEAFNKICNKYPSAELRIIGSNPKINHPQIKVLGRLQPDQLPQHYEAASIFCMPSINEPFGVVFVEAMEYALPIVAIETGAIPDMVRDGWNGLLIDPGDVIEGLSYALEKLLSDAVLCKKFGENGKSLAEENYNWNAVGKKIRNSINEYMETTP